MSVPVWTGAPPRAAQARAFFWAHPEWWCLGLSAAAWAAMIHHGLAHWGHAHHARASAAGEWLHWMEMVAAMMLPLALGPVRAAAFRSLRSRRHRAIGVFLLGYLAPWALLGGAVAGLRGVAWTHTHGVAAAAFALAAAWTLAPAHGRALVACHRSVPLAPSGWRADADGLRFGVVVGAACAASCWATMLACALTGHDLPAMLGGAAIGALERASFRPRTAAAAVASLVLAAGYAIAALV